MYRIFGPDGSIVAQGADATGVQGPLVQGRVDRQPAPLAFRDATVEPLSLTKDGSLRVEDQGARLATLLAQLLAETQKMRLVLSLAFKIDVDR